MSAESDLDARRARSSVRGTRRRQARIMRWPRSASPLPARLALDIGASTGGFTDVLLRRGAARVVALDVGHGQLDWRLRNDPRVIVLERVNARHLTPDGLPEGCRRFELVTIDVSFISLRHIFPVLPPLLDSPATRRAGEAAVRSRPRRGWQGRDRARRRRTRAGRRRGHRPAVALGLTRAGLTESPITGMEGNREFLLHLSWA